MKRLAVLLLALSGVEGLTGCSTTVVVRVKDEVRVVAREDRAGLAFRLPAGGSPESLDSLREGECVMARIVHVEGGEPFDVAWYRERGELRVLVRGRGAARDAERWLELTRREPAVSGDEVAYDLRVRELCVRASTEPSAALDELLHRRSPIFEADAEAILHHVCASPFADSGTLHRAALSLLRPSDRDVPVFALNPTALLVDAMSHPNAMPQMLWDILWCSPRNSGEMRFLRPRVLEILEMLPGDVQTGTGSIPLDLLRWKVDLFRLYRAMIGSAAADDVILWNIARDLQASPLGTDETEHLLTGIARHPKRDASVTEILLKAARELPKDRRDRVVQALEKK